MIPIRDDNPTERLPVVTYALVAANVAVFLLTWMNHEQAVWNLGTIPWEIARGANHPDSPSVGPWASLLTSMFMHGGLMHLGGNLLFLWVFGDNVEDAMGPVRYLVFYVLAGLGAHALQFLSIWFTAGAPPAVPIPAAWIQMGHLGGPSISWFIPMVGASGAISGVMAAYYRLYPHARVQMLVPIFIFMTIYVVPAAFVIGYWFLIQVLSGLLGGSSSGGGVAWWAHVGGFVTGYALAPHWLTARARNQLRLRAEWRKIKRNPW